MRILLAAAAAVSLVATASAADATPCSQTRTKDVAFGEGRTLTVTATSIPAPVALPEANCRNATVLLTVHTEGVLVTAYADAAVAASYDLGHTEEPVSAARLGAFLDSWVNLKISPASGAPDIGEGVTTGLTPEDYAAIKASTAPMFCFEQSAFDTACFAPDNSGYLVAFFVQEQS